MHVVLPEIDGRILAGVASFKESDAPDPALGLAPARHRADPERIAAIVARVEGWMALARRASPPTLAPLLALVLSTYPGKPHLLAHAVGLDALASAGAILADLGQPVPADLATALAKASLAQQRRLAKAAEAAAAAPKAAAKKPAAKKPAAKKPTTAKSTTKTTGSGTAPVSPGQGDDGVIEEAGEQADAFTRPLPPESLGTHTFPKDAFGESSLSSVISMGWGPSGGNSSEAGPEVASVDLRPGEQAQETYVPASAKYVAPARAQILCPPPTKKPVQVSFRGPTLFESAVR
jgi:hypothetical protein